MNNIQENNKLIAEFMGLTIITDEISWFDTNYKALKKYNEFWGNLMPVVEKIEELDLKEQYYSWEDEEGKNYNFEGFSVDIEGNSCYIWLNWSLDPAKLISQATEKTKIEAVYKAVLGFIEWYNKNKENGK